MKPIIIHTGKFKGFVIDLPIKAAEVQLSKPNGSDSYFHLSYKTDKNTIEGFAFFYNNFGGKQNYPSSIKLVERLADITEEQASEIMGYPISDVAKYNKYFLHDLIESEGVSLFSPENIIATPMIEELDADVHDQKTTMFNPYIFKIE